MRECRDSLSKVGMATLCVNQSIGDSSYSMALSLNPGKNPLQDFSPF